MDGPPWAPRTWWSWRAFRERIFALHVYVQRQLFAHIRATLQKSVRAFTLAATAMAGVVPPAK